MRVVQAHAATPSLDQQISPPPMHIAGTAEVLNQLINFYAGRLVHLAHRREWQNASELLDKID